MGVFGKLGPKGLASAAAFKKPMTAPAPMPTMRRGIFGRGPQHPTFMQWLMLGPNAPDVLQEREARALNIQQAREQMNRGYGEDKAATRQQDRVRALASDLSEEEQLFAEMNPTEWVRSRLQSPQWESGQGYSHAFRVNPDGTVTLGGELPLRPRVGPQGYMMPDDEWDYND